MGRAQPLKSLTVWFAAALLLGMGSLCEPSLAASARQHLLGLTRFSDRSTGSPGCEAAARYIEEQFQRFGLKNVGMQFYFQPVPVLDRAVLQVGTQAYPLFPWGPNMAMLPRTPEEGLRGPLVYVGKGELPRMDHQPLQGAIVLMDQASAGNWWIAASLSAKAVIFLGDVEDTQEHFRDKDIPTPLAFPRFYAPPQTAQRLKDLAKTHGEGIVRARAHWENRVAQNVYGLIPGRSPDLSQELVVIEASFDASTHVVGRAPGADQAVSAAMLLKLAEELAARPPERSVLLLATSGYGQGLAGSRYFTWVARGRRKDIRQERRGIKHRRKELKALLSAYIQPIPWRTGDPERDRLVWQEVVERAKDEADRLTRRIQYRKVASDGQAGTDAEIDALATRARRCRRLSWQDAPTRLDDDQKRLALELFAQARKPLEQEERELNQRWRVVHSWRKMRNLLDDYQTILHLSLNLSSRSLPMGLSEWGSTFPVREQVRRLARNLRLTDIMEEAAERSATISGTPRLFERTGRHGAGGTSKAVENPGLHCLACDIGALSDCSSVTLTTLNNRRLVWGTPNDTTDRIHWKNVDLLERFLPPFFQFVLSHPDLKGSCRKGVQGLAAVQGKALFIRQGELFPDQPAPGTIVCAIQGTTVFRTMTFRDGTFLLPGVANKRVAFQKVILEPYGIDPTTGRIAWTADKVQTGKNNYRLKIKGRVASTTLVMFHCEQTDVIGAFNPRQLGHLTKVRLLDAVTGARPLKYWYSRVDGRDTFGISVFLEKGTRFKLILADTLWRNEFLLLNADPRNPQGLGYLAGSPPILSRVSSRVAHDLRTLVAHRLDNLQRRGIRNKYLENLYREAARELKDADAAAQANRHPLVWNKTVSAWAKLNVVYSEIEKTQRDILGGVMFFVALFVPFAYCLERYLFCFRNIYKQITAFFLILLTTIFTIKALHPAFQLTYNPMVVIIAFFIVGLSLLVSWIIFVRFEQEMEAVQKGPDGLASGREGVNKWQAFGAGFAIGASNLHRRRLRTALTCVTLIILTFTVMSFTNVKSLTKTTMARIADSAPYSGVLIHHIIWRPLTSLTLSDLQARFAGQARIWPRAWIDPAHPSQRFVATVSHNLRETAVQGVLGLGVHAPRNFRKIVVRGRWFTQDNERAVLLPVNLARKLGLDPQPDGTITVTLWEQPFRVVGYFDPQKLESYRDLDSHRIQPAYLEIAPDEEISEVEVEAMESGEEILPMTQRFRFARADSLVLMPFETCRSLGGSLRAIALVTDNPARARGIAEDLSRWFSYPLFVGAQQTWYHTAGKAIRYQGVANLVVPILIVVFICLNTMIGHVHERKTEIGVYTSVGLAPVHVGFLFIVEALSLAVLSTVIGYILAQLTAKLVGTWPLFAELTFNYSSLASVACMVLVFSVVLLASLYPARMAAEMAMPDVTRSWTLPEAQGDLLELRLPFLLKPEEELGIIHFLESFIRDHQDVAHGAFIVDEASLVPDDSIARPAQMPYPVCLTLRANVWLAPFDFGIKQRLHLHCCPSKENPGYMEVAVQMIRLSGERSAWERTNKNFIRVLRKRMLLWRLLDDETKARYAQAGPPPDTLEGSEATLETSAS
ncbi:Peptidase family M28 [Desulfacinum hydrothermale DSM 13146]|uniref:Peptidase family M28 n=1 Tax=Desulfacinum hydrothermale DSM 13146 TaxID=1121390 RepID=A0A1W1XSP5_9BACT|nr:FtsX-like permease family protein [Desulfacinum hydrothermale]SMC26990.1 Peptidase family M28 [Desulfacinum hydrothermale DSM 13146]